MMLASRDGSSSISSLYSSHSSSSLSTSAAVVTSALPLSSLQLQPGDGVGPFQLGCSLGGLLDYVCSHALHLGSNSIAFCAAAPLSTDIAVTLNDLGITLRFDPRSQRCHLIDIHRFDRVALHYKKSIIIN